MAKPSILISLQTDLETEPKAFGRSFMQSLIDASPRLVPELVSTSERFKDPFTDLESFLDEWWAIPATTYLGGVRVGESVWGPLWKRRSALASKGMVNHGMINVRGERVPSFVWFESRWLPTVDFEGLFETWIALSHPNIGMFHVFTDHERQQVQGGPAASFEAGSFGGPAKPGLPNIGWAMAYGKDYAAEVDVDRLTAAGFPVEERGGALVVRVTEKLSDLVDNFAYFSQRRSELKALFRSDLFWVKDEPRVGP